VETQGRLEAAKIGKPDFGLGIGDGAGRSEEDKVINNLS
jgi:hypothetical protein